MSLKVLVELILTFRRIASHIPVFGRRFMGKLSYRHIVNLFSLSQIFADLPTKSRRAVDARPFIFKLPHFQIFKSITHTRPFDRLRDLHIAASAHRHIGTLSYRHIVLLAILLLAPGLKAQLLIPLSNEMNRRVEYEMIQNGTPFFSVMKPYVTPKSPEGDFGESRDSLTHLQIDSSSNSQISTFSNYHIKSSWFHRKLFHESLIQVDSGSFYLFADPVFEFGIGRERSGRNTYINSRGLRAGGRLGKSVAFGTEFYETQGNFNKATSDKLYKTRISPGEGIARKIDTTGYDFAHASGYLSVNISNLNIRLAQGRQFVGDGYRSLLLSDASYTYPYLNFAWHNKKFFYAWSTMLLQDIDVPYIDNKPPIRRKSATMHIAGVILFEKIQLSIVKLELYKNPDSLGTYKLDFNQLNPVLLPVKRSNKNSILGTNVRINPIKQVILYNQLSVTNPYDASRKLAVQVGGKFIFNWGNNNFYFQTEYNTIPPLTFIAGDKIYNWEHLREPLMHPYGTNLKEIVLIGIWNYKRWQIYCQLNNAKQAKEITDSSPYTLARFPYFQNNKKLNLFKAELSYFFNAKTLMNMSIGYNYRNETLSTGTNTNHYVYFSFGTRLFNKYYDF